MANKYVDVSATYNGDGTLPTPAAGAGQPGAWNDLRAVMANTGSAYPISNGDVVFIRSGLTYALSSFTMATRGSAIAPVWWMIDDGTYWSSPGEFIVTMANLVVMTLADYNYFYGFDRKWRFRTSPAGGYSIFPSLGHNLFDGVIFETTTTGTTNNFALFGYINSKKYQFRNCLFDISYFSIGVPTLFSCANTTHGLYRNCDFDITGAPSAIRMFYVNAGYGGAVEVYGGKVIGSVSTQYLWDMGLTFSDAAASFICDGLDTGSLILSNYTTSAPATLVSTANSVARITNIKNNLFGFFEQSFVGSIDWAPGQNYPVINSVLPDAGNTPWSIRAYPKNCSEVNPLIVNRLVKFYDLAAAAKTLTFELLINQSFGTPTKQQWWVDITYVDSSTGLTKAITTRAVVGNLDTSTAAWSATTYGAQSYSKYKITVVTPTAIKQNTDIVAVVQTTYKAASVNDFFFVDPDFSVT